MHPEDAPPTDPLTVLLQRAATQHAAGDFAEAEKGYRAVLEAHPNHVAALGGLGALLGQTGQADLAVRYLSEACVLEPGNVVLQHNYGEALRQLGNFPLAEATLRRVIQIAPLFAPAYESLIAIVKVAHAYALATRDAGRAETLAGELATLANNQGNALLEARDLSGAIACYRAALACRDSYAIAWSNLGNALRNEGLVSEAEEACRRAIALDARLAPAWNNLGNALAEQLRLEEASLCFERALKESPELSEAAHNRGSGMLFNQLYLPDLSAAEITRRHRAWGASFPRSLNRIWHNSRQAQRPLRVGYLSADFRTHSMRHFLEPLLARHDAQEVEVICYAENPVADAHTERMTRYGHRWTWTHRMSDAALAETIERDRIDILVDCIGHTQGTRLAALAGKPAPIMMSWLGYLCTTGLPAMDCRLTDAWVDPPGMTEDQHTETLLRIPGGMIAYRPHDACPDVVDPPCGSHGEITFGSLNNVQKVNAPLVKSWSNILRSVPKSRLLLQSKQLADPVMVGRIRGLFESFGVRPDRLELRPASVDFLRTYHEIDIALDTAPYGGGATTCDALWMGVPVITLSGDRPSGRLSTSILNQIGSPEWITTSREAYTKTAVELASDPDKLRQVRHSLRECMRNSSLCDESGFVRRLEGVYRVAWHEWLEHSRTKARWLPASADHGR